MTAATMYSTEMLVSVSQRSLNQPRMSQPTMFANAAPQITAPTMIRIRRKGWPGAASLSLEPVAAASLIGVLSAEFRSPPILSLSPSSRIVRVDQLDKQ